MRVNFPFSLLQDFLFLGEAGVRCGRSDQMLYMHHPYTLFVNFVHQYTSIYDFNSKQRENPNGRVLLWNFMSLLAIHTHGFVYKNNSHFPPLRPFFCPLERYDHSNLSLSANVVLYNSIGNQVVLMMVPLIGDKNYSTVLCKRPLTQFYEYILYI